MEYKMEELVPIVAKLADKYTNKESSSITYEKANQLMEAVLYCIHQLEMSEDNSLYLQEGIPAEKAYKLGSEMLSAKTESSLRLYNEILDNFDSFNNKCLKDTFIKGMPEFFKWYDLNFNPQDTILTLDYPVLADLTHYQGIDRIEKYLMCIKAEQIFLLKLPREYVIYCLSQCDSYYKGMIDNLAEVVYTYMIKHFIINKKIEDIDFTDEDRKKLVDFLNQTDKADLRESIVVKTDNFIDRYFKDSKEVGEYLVLALDNILLRIVINP